MGGGQPPQLPTSPPTYESVSDPTPHCPMPLPVPTDGQMDRAGQGTTQGRAVYLACLKFYLSFPLFKNTASKVRSKFVWVTTFWVSDTAD